MIKKEKFFAIALFVLMVISTGLAFVSNVKVGSGESSKSQEAFLHVNLKGGDKLHSETKDPNAEGETKWVQADYDQVTPFSRAQKRWVDVGTWTSSSRDSTFKFGTRVTFNIWYSIRDEGYNADPEFRFTLSVDGTQLVQVTGPTGQDPGDDSILEYTASGNFDPIDLEPDSELSLKIEYRAWEDCDIYYDNATYDSGFFIQSDFCKVFNYGGKDNKIFVEVYDGWDADWRLVGYYIDITIDGQDVKPGFVTKEGCKYTVDGTMYRSTLIEWTLDQQLEKGQNVTIWIKYTPADKGEDRGFEKGFEVGASGGGTPPGGGNEEESSGNDNTILFIGAGGAVVAAAAGIGIYMFVIKPRREGSQEEEEYEEEEEEEEMEYEEE